MSKVVILANSSGGLYDFRNELVTRLIGAGHEVVISLPDELRVPELQAEGARVIYTEINRRGMNPFEDLKLLNAYKKLLRDEKPNVVVGYTIKPNVYGGFASAKAGIPYIGTITGLGSTFQGGNAKKELVKKLVIMMYRIGLKKSKCVFFQNSFNRGIFEKYGIVKGVKTKLVNGSGVDLERHNPEPYPGHADEVIRFLYVGRLMKEKGTKEYLEAAHRLHEEFGDRVSVSAIGYYEDDCRELVEESVKKHELKMIPFNKDIHPFFKEADVVVMPSYHEGMSNVLMEASSTARPVLASNINGCKEIVDDNVSGFLFEPRDSDSLHEAMRKMVLLSPDERKAMGIAARKKVEREFDRHSIIDAYIDEIQKFL